MDFIYYFSVLIILATVFSYLNDRFLKLPSTIGIMVITMIFSVILVTVGRINARPISEVYEIINQIDFSKVLLGGMLYFLLFAGAIQIDIKDLREQKMPVIVFSTVSVIISTIVVGFVLYYALIWLLPVFGIHMEVSLIYCFLFGALISPTDPIAVLSILKQAKVNKSLETKITGESLFNDGVSIIAFTVIYNIARGTERLQDITVSEISWLLAKEVIGAVLVGLILGYIGFTAMKHTEDYKLSVLISLSVVIGGYMISQAMEISGPLTMVSAGILIGNANKRYSERKHITNDFLKTFWELIDEILNAVLFLLIGFELLLIHNLDAYWIPGIICIVVVLFARYVSIKIPTWIIPFKEKFSHGAIVILVWGGLRGGVSIALALSIGDTTFRDPIVAVTYFVVVFSIIVQGLSIGRIAKRIKC